MILFVFDHSLNLPYLPIASLAQKPSKLLQIPLIRLIKPISHRTVDIDNRHNLTKPASSASPQINTQRKKLKTLTFPSTKIGTTISLFDAPSHAICPGKRSTSGTSCVSAVAAATPQTPRPKAMIWQATLPWKGPRMSWGFLVAVVFCEGSRT
jgi:hypothetical protein